MGLGQGKILERAIAPLAKRFDSTAEKAKELLENHNGSLEKLILSRENPDTRQRVNKWWKQYYSDFPRLGIGVLRRVSSPAKLPESTYDQLICLAWLTDVLRREQFVRRWKEMPEKIEAPKPNLWQRFLKWIGRE